VALIGPTLVDLEVEKTVSSLTALEGGAVTYTVTVSNHGPEDATGIEVSDPLPDGTTYQSDDSGGSYDPGTGIWQVSDLAVGAVEPLRITVSLDRAGTIVNTATVTELDQVDPEPANNEESVEVRVMGTDGDGGGGFCFIGTAAHQQTGWGALPLHAPRGARCRN
jgi:uncharacterized repeat protein (TIGR01451 family)